MSQTHIQAHVDLIARHEQDFLEQRTKSERWGDTLGAFVGSFRFVGCDILLFAVWIAWNKLPGFAHFDPSPFPCWACWLRWRRSSWQASS